MEQVITSLGNWLASLSWFPWTDYADTWATILVWLVYALIIAFGIAPAAMIVLTWLERKILARIQDRIGPNRAGPFGVLQAVSDAIKMLTKEDITPQGADRVPYNLAPGLMAISAILLFAVIPFAPNVIGADLNIGLFYIMAVGAFGVLGVLIAGWSSNNKYALLGAFRAVSQLVSYEIPMVITLLTVTIVVGSMSMSTVVEQQSMANGGWYLIAMPLTFFIFLTASLAEVGRSPFDLLEAESELVAGFHVEYSGMKYAMIMIGEYVHMLGVAVLCTTLFMGGWRGPGVESLMASAPFWGSLLGVFYFLLKTFLFIFLMMWVRGTFPRVRIDQLLDFGWKFLTPVSLVNLLMTAFIVKLFQPASGAGVAMPAGPLAAWGGIGQTIVLLLSNILVFFIASLVVRAMARRGHDAGLRAVAAIDS